jgi:predicted secreted protein
MRPALLFATLILLSTPALAESETYNRVDLNSEAAHEVPNDLLSANLSVEFSDKSATRVAQQINAALNDALQKAAPYHAVKAASGNQQTYPIYGKNNQLESWRGHAEIRLESRDFKAAGELIAELQNKMQLSGVSFSVAPDTRRELENTLTVSAIAAFKKRADAVRLALDGKGYKLIHLSINNGGYVGHPQPMLARGMVADMAVATPEFAGGASQLNVQVSGTIEITQ